MKAVVALFADHVKLGAVSAPLEIFQYIATLSPVWFDWIIDVQPDALVPDIVPILDLFITANKKSPATTPAG